jgi:hypothetical protein
MEKKMACGYLPWLLLQMMKRPLQHSRKAEIMVLTASAD